MSDLQCPATVLIARHGEAMTAVDGVLSDDDGPLTVKGRGQVHDLVGQVRGRRVAAVYSSRTRPSIESAELAASELGLAPVAVDGLQEFSVGDLAGASFHDEARFTEAIEEIADVHRGETVLVFSHGAAMSLAIPRLAANMRNDLARQRVLPNCAVAEVEVDSDGWRLVSWPSVTDSEQP